MINNECKLLIAVILDAMSVFIGALNRFRLVKNTCTNEISGTCVSKSDSSWI